MTASVAVPESVRWSTPSKLGLVRRPPRRARIGRVAEETANRLGKGPNTVHKWLHSEFDGPQHRVAAILRVADEHGEHELAGKLLRPILGVYSHPREVADEIQLVGGLIERLHQLLYELGMWAFHRRTGPEVARLMEGCVCQMLSAAGTLAHYDGAADAS